MWAKHYTAGRLVVAESDEEKKEIVIRMEELSLHPIFCLYLLGYFSSITQMVVGSAVIGKETACAFKQGTYHEYTFNW